MIQAHAISKTFFLKKQKIEAVKNISFTIREGEIFSLVGSSGSGKSTIAEMIMGLKKPTSGQIFFKGKEIHEYGKKLALVMQIVFQDPFTSLNPMMKVEKLIDEPLLIWGKKTRTDELLDMVELSSDLKTRYPHELSGGQRQRVMIARAISLNPNFLILDEFLSAQDIFHKKALIRLIKRLLEDLKLTILLISHDERLVADLSTNICKLN